MRLAGHLEIKGLTFGYRRYAEPLLSDFNLVIEPGQRVAVVGPSGSGKSTLAMLVGGLWEPWAGEILFDGAPREQVPAEVMADLRGVRGPGGCPAFGNGAGEPDDVEPQGVRRPVRRRPPGTPVSTRKSAAAR